MLSGGELCKKKFNKFKNTGHPAEAIQEDLLTKVNEPMLTYFYKV